LVSREKVKKLMIYNLTSDHKSCNSSDSNPITQH